MKEVRLKRMLAGALAAALALGAAPAALAAEPQVQVRAANIDNEYLEIGLVIPAETTMQSAAVVLTYDTAKLEPVDWSGTTVTPGGSWTDAEQLPAKGSDATTGKPALVYEDGGKGYLFLSAESAKALTVTGSTALQATTVRFRYETEKPTSDTAEAIGSVTLASAEEAAGSPAGQPTLFSDGTQNTALAAPPAIIYDKAGTSVAGGSGDTSSFAPIVFYDWDGTTLLGSIVAAKDAKVGDAIITLMSTVTALKEKTGYVFDNVWIKNASDLPTNYNDGAGSTLADLENEQLDFTKQSVANLLGDNSAILAKAAYAGTDELNGQYVVTVSSDSTNFSEANFDYNKFGTTDNYSVKFHVARNTAVRARKAAVRAVMTTTDGVALYSLAYLDNRDNVIIELAPNNKISSVQVNVIDMYGVSNWVSQGAKSANKTINQGDLNAPGFLLRGAVNQVNTQIAMVLQTGDETEYTNSVAWSTVAALQVDTSALTGNNNVKARTARQYWKTAYEAKGSALTWKELDYALTHAGEYHNFPADATNP